MGQDTGPVYQRGWISRLERPRGFTGRPVGWFLARFNAGLNREAVSRLPLTPDSRVLEVGFGPGVALHLLLERVTRATVSGIDPSEEMHRQAARRNRAAVESGRLDLRHGTAVELPWPKGSFDAILSVNNILFWSPRDQSLREVARVLRPGGVFVAGVHEWAVRSHSRGSKDPLSQTTAELTEALRSAGLSETRSEVIGVTIGQALLVSARKPGGPDGPSTA